jgi:hypothetical protein
VRPYNEADNDTIDDVDLTAHAEYAGSVNGKIFDNFQLFFPDISCLSTMQVVRRLATFDCIWANFAF